MMSSLRLACMLAAVALAGCSSGRNIHYTPVVKQNLDYLENMSKRMADAAALEYPKFPAPEAGADASQQRAAILGAITKGVVGEVAGSSGGFQTLAAKEYEGVVRGGLNAAPRELDSVEKAQLDLLMQLVTQTQKYEENIINYYERDIAQVASPVFVNGQIVAVAWIRYQLPSAMKSLTEGNKFERTTTSHSPRAP